jgi:hypothetical protein
MAWNFTGLQALFATGSGPGSPTCLENQRGDSVSKSQRLGSSIKPKAPLVKQWSKQFVSFWCQLGLHVNSITWQRKM